MNLNVSTDADNTIESKTTKVYGQKKRIPIAQYKLKTMLLLMSLKISEKLDGIEEE